MSYQKKYTIFLYFSHIIGSSSIHCINAVEVDSMTWVFLMLSES